MKTRLRVSVLLGLACLGLQTRMPAEPAERYELAFAEGSRLWLEGDSTFHGYTCNAEVLKVDSEIVIDQEAEPLSPATVLRDTDEGSKLTTMVLTIPVKNMTSGIVGLASTMRKALKYKKHPNIVFTMHGYTIQGEPEQPERYRIVARGDLRLAGETRAIEVKMSATINDGQIAVQGEKDLRMTDFDVEPPTAMFGAIKAADEVVIKWDLKVALVPKERRRVSTEQSPDKE